MSKNLPESHISATVKQALAEDIGEGDITALLIPEENTAEAIVITREQAVVCGTAWVDEVFAQLDPAVRIEWRVRDGDEVKPGDILLTLSGPARSLLTGERTALNFLQTLSGTATIARQFAALVKLSLIHI